MRIELHPDAAHDLDNAFSFYRHEAGTVVAQRFLDEFEHIARFAAENPALGTPVERGRRRLVFRIFPYSLIYRQLDDCIRILVIRHHHRSPGFGQRRR